MKLREYKTLSKTKALEYFTETQWDELCLHAVFLSKWAADYGVEDVPEVKGDNINFKSFIGDYLPNGAKNPLQIALNNEKLSVTEYNQIILDILEWCNILGPNVLSQLNFLPPDIKNDRILSYSNQLIELAELTKNTYLTPLIKQEIKIGPMVYGRIDLPKTIKYLTQAQPLIVSKKTKIVPDTLPVLLLIRFNLQMSIDLENLFIRIKNRIYRYKRRNETISIERMAKRNLLYHQDILLNPRHRPLLSKSIETDFYDPEIIEETYSQTYGNALFQDIIMLWEGYITHRTLQSSIIENLTGEFTLKPVSKIYELWLLRIIDNALRSELGEPQPFIHPRGAMTLIYRNRDKEFILNYNLNIPRNWRKIKNFPYILRPDFVISCKTRSRKNKILLIADAKYKESVKSSDVQQMLAYMLTTGWSEGSDRIHGLLLYAGCETKKTISRIYRRQSPNGIINLIKVRPSLSFDELTTTLKTIINQASFE